MKKKKANKEMKKAIHQFYENVISEVLCDSEITSIVNKFGLVEIAVDFGGGRVDVVALCCVENEEFYYWYPPEVLRVIFVAWPNVDGREFLAEYVPFGR